MTTTDEATPNGQSAAAPDLVVIPTSTARDAGVTLTELLSSFYLWLLVWLVAWAAIPALLIGWEPVLITSGSMGPSITAGDLVLIGEPPAGELLAPGTVITFESRSRPGRLVTHRIDGVREDGLYRTRGDANEGPDPDPVHTDDIVGVGRMLVPLVGLPLQWLQTDLVSFALFVLGTAAAAVATTASRKAAAQIADAATTETDEVAA